MEDTVSYYFDSRNVERRRARRLLSWTVDGDVARPNEDARTAWEDAEKGDLPEVFIVRTSGFRVCPTCEGYGTHVNPSIDAHGIGREEFDEDPDFEEAYFAGAYDVTCGKCNGQRVVANPPTCDHPMWESWTKWLEEVCGDDPDDVSEARYFGY